MYQEFLTFIRKNELLTEGDRLLLALSGGVDSMVLAHLISKAGYSVEVAHVNYGLRGRESDADEALVRNWCEANQVPFHLRRVLQEEYETNESIQMVARRIRYEYFEELRNNLKIDQVVTAHNLNDSLETVLLNLTKGTGIHGLTGISVKRDHLIRPLLFATKEEIYAFAKAENLQWREDKSNAKNDYQRNMIRNQVIPLLKQINPNLEHTFDQTSRRLRGAVNMVDERIEDLVSRIEHQGEMKNIDLEWFSDTPGAILLLDELIKQYGFSFADTRDLAGSIVRGESGKLFYSATHQINLDRGVLLVSTKKRPQHINSWIPEVMGEVNVGSNKLRLSTVNGQDFPRDYRQDVAYFDRDKVSFPLHVRSWQQGDIFRPLGMKGKKKISDYMIDSKIPVTLKHDILVMESGGEIVWLVGHRIDDRFKVTDSTSQMLKVEVINYA